MKLSELIRDTGYAATGDAVITGITYDSRNVTHGNIFVALPGKHVDGRKFAADAVARGAAAVVINEKIEGLAAAQIVAADPLEAMAALSARFYRHPDEKLRMIGITGTNGKTTITYLLEYLFGKMKLSTGVVGTVNYRFGKTVHPAPNTTPQSADLYRFLREMADHRGKAAVMEVSSHALALGRVAGIEFDCAIFTNLTRDHLDFHGTMEGYFSSKAKLFEGLVPIRKTTPKFAIINKDDPWGEKLVSRSGRAKVITYGLAAGADVRAENIRITSHGNEFVMTAGASKKKVHMLHLGKHNVYNALAAAAAAMAYGMSFDTVADLLAKAPMAPGRLERVDAGQNFTVVVDYAHTDDALTNVMTALKALQPARLITVFGCGGDRDRSKRPLMGDAATAVSDFVFVTSDNPRSEDPQKIALDIEVGIRRHQRDNYQVIVDREQAIASAIAMAQKGDIVLIAGKGHENYQIVGDHRLHFNDTEVARKYLQQKRAASASLDMPVMRIDLNGSHA